MKVTTGTFRINKEKKVDSYKGTVCMCSHCGEQFGSNSGKCALYCKYCKTKPQRQAMCDENREILKGQGYEYECQQCDE